MTRSQTRSTLSRSRRLLYGASTFAFAAALSAGPASAQLAALHNAAHVPGNAAGVPTVAVPAIPGLATAPPAMTNAALRSLHNAMTAQQAVSLAMQAQTAARQAAAALPSAVANGLAPGGLVPVANAVRAASDPTGLNTWEGAALPTQTAAANGAVTVDIQQTASRAVLDWQTFNVGANTTLTFNQSQNGVAQSDWVALNRVVGQLDPVTGLRNPNLAPAPSQIFGAIKSQGTVLVINQNGILFSPTAQININSLIATSLEIGSQLFSGIGGSPPSTIAQRNNIFLTGGLLIGGADSTFSGQAVRSVDVNDLPITMADPLLEGAVTVQAGAQISSGQGGYILLAAPQVVNSGSLASSQGQVSLVSGRVINLSGSDGTSNNGNNPDIRGLAIRSRESGAGVTTDFTSDYVDNTATGLIQASEGYASLTGTTTGTIINAGVITASTSVSRNGFIQLGGANIQLAPTSVIAIIPDDNATIPQDPTSLADFKSSRISIGEVSSVDGALTDGANIDLASGSLIYAPSAAISIGTNPAANASASSVGQVFIDSGAVIDAAGLKDVQIAASTNEVTISPVTANDTADTPTQRNTLDHTTVTVDPRQSGVRADGVVWVGSPLIPAQAFADQVGVTASQLMTKGGNVTIGAISPGASGPTTPSVIIKPGAVIDISGGWETFQAGLVQTTQLISANGTLVDIADASPDEVYLGVYNGFTATQPRYGVSQTFANPLLSNGHYDPAYIQGGDAGSLTIETSAPSLQGTIYANAFTGPLQAQMAQVGTASSTIFGDQRHLQAVGSQLPTGGYLSILEFGGTGGAGLGKTSLSGGDIDITGGSTPTTTSGLVFGQTVSIAAGGTLSVAPVVSASSTLSATDQATLTLSAPSLSAMGLGQLTLATSGALTVESNAAVRLAPGGVLSAVTGRTITVDGSVTTPSGVISLQTVDAGAEGSIFNPRPDTAGDYDVVINGQLSTAGLWTNDFGAIYTSVLGPAYTNGGAINIVVASRILDGATDISGSILAAGPNSLLDVSSGGYITPSGALSLTAKGGDVSLTDYTAYFPFELQLLSTNEGVAATGTGYTPGFRVNGLLNGVLPDNPGAITSQVAIGDGAIRGYGFAGGGTFSLTTPSIAFASGIASSGTALPLDFFSKAGFATYNITSYATDLIPNAFANGLGGYNAVLATQVATVQSGQTLNLTQTSYSTNLTGDQIAGLRNLPSGGQVSAIVTPSIQPDTFDQLPVNLNLGGLVEFEAAPGGQVIGAPGAALTASEIYNQGAIRLPGGTLSQVETLPSSYAGIALVIPQGPNAGNYNVAVAAASSLSAIFSVNADGSISETSASVANPALTNAQLAATDAIYFIGNLPAGVGLSLAPGSITDLSGAVVVNPNITGVTQGRQIVAGSVLEGGVLQSASESTVASASVLFPVSPLDNNPAFAAPGSSSTYIPNPVGVQIGLSLVAAPGASVNLNGASGVFDQLTSTGQYVQAPQWSNGGALTLGAGGTLTGAAITAFGGAPQAAGGVLTTRNLTLTAVDPATPLSDTLSAQQIQSAGFGTLVVQGDLSTSGDAPVNLSLPQAFYLTGAPMQSVDLGLNPVLATIVAAQPLFPTVSAGDSLQITAPYVSLDGGLQGMAGPTYSADVATTATGNVTFNAQALDVTGAVLFDQAVATVTLNASGDLRFIGVGPFQSATVTASPSVAGQLAVNGDLKLNAAQVYATTGTSFDVTSTAAAGTIAVTDTSTTPPPTPYSAGSALLIQAANIVQDGVVRAPIGSLTLGSNAALDLDPGGSGGATPFAPATLSLQIGAGSVTSVSADGLSIPYGTTTDQKEYFFSPASAAALSAPPQAVLTLAGQSVTTAPGATVNLNGGGDVFAYEFIPGTGGSRDVLSQFNADTFTSNAGYQYADHRQVYAIVPGLSNASVAAYDPIYSSNYAALYAPTSAGQRVYLNGGQGVSAGWYTLLPAQYAVLPGGMELVEDTAAITVPVGSSSTQLDGSVAVTGHFGSAGGVVESAPHVFDIKTQAVIATYSNIALTSGNANFAAQAASAGVATPRLPLDAGRLIVNPETTLDLAGAFETTPASGGRGSEIDISASVIDIVSGVGPTTPGVVQLSAGQLSGLNADSLFIGGVRTDNVDGTTALNVTASQITVANDATHPLTAPDILLAVDGQGSAVTLISGATLTASGTDSTGQTGVYTIDGSITGQSAQGVLVRVSSGSQRLVTRQDATAGVQTSGLTAGAVNLTGASLLLDSSGDVSLDSNAALSANSIALDASSIAFASSAQGLPGLVITPSLLTSLGKAQTLTLRSPQVIGFADGRYGFGALNFDTPGVAVSSATGAVAVSAQAVQVQDSFTDTGACTIGGALACGAGQVDLTATSLIFGDGTFRIYGAGGGVSLTAPSGVFYQGRSAFDVGAAPLAIHTAFLGDQASPDAKVGSPAVLPSLAITTTGSLILSNPTDAATPTVSGVPGARLTLSAQSVAVAGVDVRATAGVLSLTSATSVDVGAGATLETPGFSESFGDAADPFSENAPGGLLTLTALNGGITLASGSTVSVGGGVGAAGSLSLNAGLGSVSFGGTVNGAAPISGASFALNEAGGFDLAGFETATKGAFNGEVSIQTGLGDLVLSAGQTLTAADVSLTANGGAVSIGGTIDVSGINGGDVSLFGANGVTLGAGALLAARASGYGPGDTRQATAGQVELGTAGTGAITVTPGAVIDVSAAQTSPRVVEGEEDGLITYNYVPADLGGAVTLRAPALGGDNAETVNVAFGGMIKGARTIVLEGYKAYDLGVVAASGQFSGVTVAGGIATLDTTASGRPNFLADDAPGTLVDFIQNFNISDSYANLGGLASQANFHARPGVELDYGGDIILASNWNLGAGTVNVAGAAAAGLFTPDTGIPGAYTVAPGAESSVFSNFTHLTYRVGGGVLGEPGALSIKAAGQLDIDGSITDGFFSFGDQTDPNFLNSLHLTTYSATAPVSTSINLGAITSKVAVVAPIASIPYDESANSPGAPGLGSGGAGDPIGNAEIFPLVQTIAGPQAAASWSYQLTGGATSGGPNPGAVMASAPGGVTVQGVRTYTVQSSSSFTDTLLFQVGRTTVTADQLLAADLAANPSLRTTSRISVSFASAPTGAEGLLSSTAANFFAAYPGQFTFTGSPGAPSGVSTTLLLATTFLQQVAAEWPTLKTFYSPPSSGASLTATATNLIRTGAGSISVAAAGVIDLRNGATPTYLDRTTGATTTVASGYQLGGAAIYTAGVPAVPDLVTAIDSTTGAAVTLDPSTFATLQENVAVVNYGYGLIQPANGFKGLVNVVVGDAVYANGGGDVSLSAGGSVLGRRDAYDSASLLGGPFDTGVNNDFVGFYNQPWRVGLVGSTIDSTATNILINPQLFREGVATLGGGNVTVRAAGDVSDLTTVADTTLTTGVATGGVVSGQVSEGLLTFGGGDVTIKAGGDLLGGRLDVASGQGTVAAGGGVLPAGSVDVGAGVVDNTLRLRLTDAAISLAAHGDVELQGVAALGVQIDGSSSITRTAENAYASNFYSPNAAVAVTSSGSVVFDNTGDVLPVAVGVPSAVLPGSLTAVALEGTLTLNGDRDSGSTAGALSVLLDPSPTGTLTLAAGADIAPVTLAMLDSQPSDTDIFPVGLPSTTEAQLQAEHDPRNLHKNDEVPNRIYAGGDINNIILSLPKQTRIGAGRDIVNMVFFGQNLNTSDITRIVAGRDITATTQLETAAIASLTGGAPILSTTQQPTLQGNTFILGGPGSLMLEAGRNLGPFLTSSTISVLGDQESFAGGVLTVGNLYNPNLAPLGASIDVEFGVSKGQDFDALSNYYLNPANIAALPDYLFSETLNVNNVYVPDKSKPIYAPQLIAYMQANQASALEAAFGTTSVSYAQAYQAFAALAPLQQRPFLLQVYFNELALTSQPGPTFDQYQRGYTAVNLLFPSSLGYTANDLIGGTNGANSLVKTGDLDLRLAAVETQYGGSIDILGPGGRVLAGSTVATAQQAARRYSEAPLLYSGNPGTADDLVANGSNINAAAVEAIDSIPAGFEGVLTLRGGGISTFTDGDFVLNQSRLFTEQGGDIIQWSSNGDLNAGEGPKTSSNFPPVVVSVDENAYSQLDQATGVTGAGIAAFQPAPGIPAPNVFLIAPRGTVDAGAAGVRVAGNLFVAALSVANADNFQVAGTSIGLPPASAAVNVSTQSSNAAASATKAAQDAVARAQSPQEDRSIITVDILGFGDPECTKLRPCDRVPSK